MGRVGWFIINNLQGGVNMKVVVADYYISSHKKAVLGILQRMDVAILEVKGSFENGVSLEVILGDISAEEQEILQDMADFDYITIE